MDYDSIVSSFLAHGQKVVDGHITSKCCNSNTPCDDLFDTLYTLANCQIPTKAHFTLLLFNNPELVNLPTAGAVLDGDRVQDVARSAVTAHLASRILDPTHHHSSLTLARQRNTDELIPEDRPPLHDDTIPSRSLVGGNGEIILP